MTAVAAQQKAAILGGVDVENVPRTTLRTFSVRRALRRHELIVVGFSASIKRDSIKVNSRAGQTVSLVARPRHLLSRREPRVSPKRADRPGAANCVKLESDRFSST